MAKFPSLLSKIAPQYNTEEMEALSEPSIMDEYLKQNDPEQYDQIEKAKQMKFALESATNVGPSMGSLKAVAQKASPLENWLLHRQNTDPNFGKMEQVIKDIPAVDPSTPRLSPEDIARLKGYANKPVNEQELTDKFKLLSAGQSVPKSTPDSLPMDQASRIARAKEMGFDPNKTYYHGTAKNFSEFDPKFNGKHTIDSQTNTGHYFSDEPEMANVYAEMEKNGANIMPVHLKMENPNIIDLNRTSIPIFRTDLINKAKELGHDSILFKNALDKGSGPLGADIPLVFEPSQIRSVNAAFDPAKKDSKDILAGLGGAAILGSQSDEENSNFDKLKQLLQQK